MRLLFPIAALPLLLVLLAASTEDAKPGDAKASEDGFVPMFNGKDLTGWVNVNCAPDTFFVKDEQIITTGKPTGFLRTEKQYENFIAEFDWMHVPAKPGAVGNSGFFVWADPIPAVGTGYTRGIEVQVLVNLTYKNKKGEITATSQGDLFSIWGAKCVPDRPHPDGWDRCLPSEDHCKGENEWNHYRVEANDGRITLAVNGHVVSGVSKCNPRKGYLALESEGSECHFKNLKIKELPSTNPRPEEVADEAQGHKSLLNGIDLSGWKARAKTWTVSDGVLTCAGGGDLTTGEKLGRYELVFDWNLPPSSYGAWFMTVSGCDLGFKHDTGCYASIGGAWSRGEIEPLKTPAKAGDWHRTVIRFDGTEMTVVVNGQKQFLQRAREEPAAGPIIFQHNEGLELRNIFLRELK